LFHNDATLHVPRVYQDLTTEAVLTMEFVDGFRVSDQASLRSAGISPRDVAANGAHIFMKQAFELGLFHGDPHPGNIRVLPDGSLCLLDYGMVGSLDDEMRERLVDLMMAIVRQDVPTLTRLILTMGQPVRPVDLPLLRADVRDFVANYYGLSLEQLKVGNMLSDFVSILAHHGIHCPPDLMLLIRAIVTLEGVGRDLDPNFNIAEHLAPFVQKIIRERYNPRYITNRILNESRTLLTLAAQMPHDVSKTLGKLSRDELTIRLRHEGMEQLIPELDRSSNRIVIGLLVASLIVASALLIRTGVQSLWLSGGVFVLSSLLGIWLIYGILRSGRL